MTTRRKGRKMSVRLRAYLRGLFQSRAREEAVRFRGQEPLPYGRGSVFWSALESQTHDAGRKVNEQ